MNSVSRITIKSVVGNSYGIQSEINQPQQSYSNQGEFWNSDLRHSSFVRCHICQELGHVKKYCPDRHYYYNARLNNKNEQFNSHQFTPNSKQKGCVSVFRRNSRDRPYNSQIPRINLVTHMTKNTIPIKVGARKTSALVDSGASVTIINKYLLERTSHAKQIKTFCL